MILDALRLALGTLTAVPVPPPRHLDPPVPGRAMLLAPAAAIPVGAAAGAATALGAAAGLGGPAVAGCTIAVSALLSRGLHLDGLADTADGLAASYDRSRALEVMRRGDTGPIGVAVLVITLIVQAGALASVLAPVDDAPADIQPLTAAVLVLFAVAGARLAVPLACLRGVASARSEGLGALVAESVGRLQLAVCVVLTAAVASVGLMLVGGAWWAGLVLVAVVVGAAALVIARAVRRLGGITGDVIGAAVEVATTAALLALALLAPW